MKGLIPTVCFDRDCLKRGEYMRCYTQAYKNCKGVHEGDSPNHDCRDKPMTPELLQKLMMEGL